MSWKNYSVDNDDDDEEESEFHEKNPYVGREGIIFLIDARKEMFVKDLKKCLEEDENDESSDKDVNYSTFQLALLCCKELMLSKIRLSSKSMISVILFGVENGDTNRKHIVELVPLSVPNASKINQLDHFMSKSPNDFRKEYGHSTDAYLVDALPACMLSFSSCSVTLGYKRILLFTKDDNPDASHSDKQHQICQRANDISQAGIDLDIIPFGSQFDTEKFYQEIVQTVKKERFVIHAPFDNINDILDTINRETHVKRSIARIQFRLGHEVTIGIGIYRFTHKNSGVKKTLLSRESNEQVRSVRQHLDVETGAVLRSYNIMKKTEIGQKDIFFSTDELSKMRKQFEPGMTLLGFKPKDIWKVEHQCSPPFFLFPDDAVIKGSRQLFTALLRRCAARDLVAICVLTTRHGSRPKYVVLVPQLEDTTDSTQKQPSGFYAYQLPFARMHGDMPNLEGNFQITEKELAIVRSVIKRAKIRNFRADYFENPLLVKHWDSVEAMALQYQNPKQFVDSTMLPFEKIGGRLKSLTSEFNEAFPNDSPGKKRKGDVESNDDEEVKIPKRSEVCDLVKQKKIEKLTIAQLKELLQLVPTIPNSAKKKADYIKLVYKHFDEIKHNI
ncbi:inverted repeat-binding protein [Lycorma delicatula]|uniref:inverted repeat-binding protein n=1 Tax=Lycorma delicatula TaxID=130591 RepID=UPI003F514733